MSTIPSRTRSLRKPSDASSSRQGRPLNNALGGDGGKGLEEMRPPPVVRSSQSSSRLPVKPPTRTASSSTARPTSSSGTISSSGSSSMPPPPPRATTSKPPSTTTTSGGLHRSASTSASSRRPNDVPTANSGLQRSTSNRRPSATSSTSNVPPRTTLTRRSSESKPSTTSAPDPIKQDRSRPPLTQSRHLRTASTSSSINASSTHAPPTHGHTRNKSYSSLTGSTRPPPTDEHRLTGENPQLKKASFSTYQQHFSPAKSLAPKPHPAAFLAPPSPSKLPSNIAISAEIAKLQNELLQLHLLHKDAGAVGMQWRASAKRKLGTRFQSVVNKNDRLVQLEVEEMGKVNAEALKRWQGQGVGWGLEEKIQVLDEVLTGAWNMGESGGKYSRVVRRFEKWLLRSQRILEARERGEGLENDEVVFLEQIDQSWKDECANIGRKLVGWHKQLRELGMPEGGSSFAVVVEGCSKLVGGMLEELRVMAKIEGDAMRMEGEWIKSMNDDEMSDDDDGDRPVAGAIWRSR